MQFTSELIEAARSYWTTTTDLNPDAGIITALNEFFDERPETPTKAEIDRLAFEILTTTR